jgi:hypothetical protein
VVYFTTLQYCKESSITNAFKLFFKQKNSARFNIEESLSKATYSDQIHYIIPLPWVSTHGKGIGNK